MASKMQPTMSTTLNVLKDNTGTNKYRGITLITSKLFSISAILRLFSDHLTVDKLQ